MAAALLVTCLCADWCTTCAAYRVTFAAVAAAHPEVRFAWIDIEDDSDALGDAALAIENFPTLQIQRNEQVLFHGTVLPHGATLTTLLDALSRGDLARGDAAAVSRQMAEAVWRLGPARPI
jgi:thiol-disulfide isomerase/thioredoxin